MSPAATWPRLRPQPDWQGAAEILATGCLGLPDEEARVRWMERLCLSLGDALYPAFLKVLCHVGEHADVAARQAVADTLVRALVSGRLPSGRQAAWGGGGPTRGLGPVEFLCAWHAQPGHGQPLSALAFERAACALLGLLSHSPAARQLYCARLLADAEGALEGGWSRQARTALQALALAWRDAGPHDLPQVAEAFLRILHPAGEYWPLPGAVWAGHCL
jgi:hypothetical protein